MGRVHGLFTEHVDVDHRLSPYEGLTTEQLRVLAADTMEERTAAKSLQLPAPDVVAGDAPPAV